MFRISVLVALLVVGPWPSATPGDLRGQATVVGVVQSSERLGEREVAALDWALGRFDEVGLELPRLSIDFDPSRRECGFADGRFRSAGSIHRVVICTEIGPSFRADLELRRTLLHEFAHAWETVNLNDAGRAGLLPALDVEAWNDPDDAWADRGAERFAEVFVFALLDQPLRQLEVPGTCSAMVDVFEEVTGRAPLGPGAPDCDGEL